MEFTLTVGSGDLTVSPEGVLLEPFRGGDRMWPWSQVLQLAFEEDEEPLLRHGLLGLAFKRRTQSLIVLTTQEDDHVMEADEPMAELRSVARRIVAGCPDAQGKVSVCGLPISTVGIDPLSEQ